MELAPLGTPVLVGHVTGAGDGIGHSDHRRRLVYEHPELLNPTFITLRDRVMHPHNINSVAALASAAAQAWVDTQGFVGYTAGFTPSELAEQWEVGLTAVLDEYYHIPASAQLDVLVHNINVHQYHHLVQYLEGRVAKHAASRARFTQPRERYLPRSQLPVEDTYDADDTDFTSTRQEHFAPHVPHVDADDQPGRRMVLLDALEDLE
jgi:hypothetical protein